MSWTLRHDGVGYAIDEGDGKRVTELRANGEVVDLQTAEFWEKVTLTHGDVEFEAQWGPTNHLTSAHLIEHTGDGDDAVTRLGLRPPPGSRAEKREIMARDHPVRFTLMRVAVAALQIIVSVLGIGALISAFVQGLLPRIDLSWLPSISIPDWLRNLDPLSWLLRLLPDFSLPTISLPSWLTAYAQYWGPLVIAAVVAVGEIERRRRQAAARDARENDDLDDPEAAEG